MVTRPRDLGAYEFVVVAALRAKQLMAGCTATVDGDHGAITKAQMEVAARHVARSDGTATEGPLQCNWQR